MNGNVNHQTGNLIWILDGLVVPKEIINVALSNGLTYQEIYRRMYYLDWPLEKAISTP